VFNRRALDLWPSIESVSGGNGSCVREAGATASFTDKDPLPELSVRGCTVLYAGKPIHEAESPDAAIIYLDRHISVYE
jgi:hypothetical protein